MLDGIVIDAEIWDWDGKRFKTTGRSVYTLADAQQAHNIKMTS